MSGFISNTICRTPTTEPPKDVKLKLNLKKSRSELRKRNSATQIDRSTRSAGHVQKRMNSKWADKASCDRFYRFLEFYTKKEPLVLKRIQSYDQSPNQRISLGNDLDAENADCKKRLSFEESPESPESPKRIEEDIADLQNLLQNTTLYANPRKIAKLQNYLHCQQQKSASSGSRRGITAPPNTPINSWNVQQINRND